MRIQPRASLEEVLNHQWMYSSKSEYTRRPNSGSLLSAEGNPPIATYAALKWPDEIDYDRFHVYATLDSGDGNSEDAWRYLTETLALVSCLCEARDDAFDAAGQVQTCSSTARKHPLSSTLLFRKIRALADHRQAWSLFKKTPQYRVCNGLDQPVPGFSKEAPKQCSNGSIASEAHNPRSQRGIVLGTQWAL
jgi:hypothetical protein